MTLPPPLTSACDEGAEHPAFENANLMSVDGRSEGIVFKRFSALALDRDERGPKHHREAANTDDR